MDININSTDKPLLDNLVEFLKELSVDEQKEFNAFIQGIKFAKKLERIECA